MSRSCNHIKSLVETNDDVILEILRLARAGPSSVWSSNRMVITTRASWMANNAIPDSIIMNMICRSLGPPVELNEPNVRSTEVVLLTSKNTLRILSTIKPVTRAFTTMDAAQPVRSSVSPRGVLKISPFSVTISVPGPFVAIQVARGCKFKSAFQRKIYDSLTYVCNCQKRRNNHDTEVFTPHDPTTVYLWRFKWIKRMIGTMIYAYQRALGDEVTTTVYCDFDNHNAM